MSRCIDRSEKAGPRGHLNSEVSVEIVKLCVDKTKDSDATVRKEATDILKVLIRHDDSTISSSALRLTKELESSNPRLYKTLQSNTGGDYPDSNKKDNGTVVKAKRSSSQGRRRPSNLPKGPKKSVIKVRSASVKRASGPKASKQQQSNKATDFVIPADEDTIDLEEASAYLSTLNIPKWSDEEDEGGIVLGLKSSNWKFRKEAINSLAEFTLSESGKSSSEKYPESVLIFVKEQTKQFKESNFNILKAIIELFLAVFELYEMHQNPVDVWMTRRATIIAVEKIVDKKFSTTAPVLLTRLCELQLPAIVIGLAIETVKSIKSPLQHEGMLSWMSVFCIKFGATALGKCVPTCVDWVVEVSSTNKYFYVRKYL